MAYEYKNYSYWVDVYKTVYPGWSAKKVAEYAKAAANSSKDYAERGIGDKYTLPVETEYRKTVNKNTSPTPTPSSTAMPSATPAPTATPAAGSALANLTGGGTTGTGQYANKLFVNEKAGVMTAADAKASFYKWTDKQLNAFIKTLGSYGIKNVTPAKAEQMWIMAVDGASTWYSKSGGTKQITPEQYIKWNSKPTSTGSGTANLPQKQVYLYDKATIQGLIDDTLSSTLGRKATDDENKQFYTAIKAMIDEGTVTTTATKVVNGKKTLVSTTTPGFSQEAAAAAIQEKIKTGTVSQQQDYLQKKSLDFGDFLSQLGG